MPKVMVYGILLLLTLLLIPPALIAWRRTHLSKAPRIHFVLDMDNQPRFNTQQEAGFFRDGRTMRPVVEGTVARGALVQDERYTRGAVGDTWVTSFPSQVTVNRALLERGQERFNIYCAPCHGHAGYGDGMVHLRAMTLLVTGVNGTEWVAPKSLHETAIAEQPLGKTFNSITNGVRNMAGYASQIPTADRWAIVAYVKALQMSQNADIDALPADLRPTAADGASAANDNRAAGGEGNEMEVSGS